METPDVPLHCPLRRNSDTTEEAAPCALLRVSD